MPARAGRAACSRPRWCWAGPCSAICADLAVELTPPGEPVAVHARPEEHRELRELVGERARSRLVLVRGPPRADAAVLRTDRFYDPARLRRRLRRGGSPESAVLWRLDRPEASLLGRRGADPAADLSADRQVLGIPPGANGWPSGSARRGSGPTP